LHLSDDVEQYKREYLWSNSIGSIYRFKLLKTDSIVPLVEQ
jgi:hypothetical protein